MSRSHSFITVLCILLASLFLPVFSKDYRGAELRTKQAFTYGRFVVRMKSAQASGMLSSFFTYHEISSLNDWNELDIEIMGRYSDEVQFNAITPGQQNHVYEQKVKFNPHKAFHVYAMEWTPDYVAWWVDSVEVYRQTVEHIQTLKYSQKLMMNIWPPTYVDWAGALDPNKLPLFAFYDWVEYYSYTPGAGDNFTLQWRDDFNALNSTRWEKGTHTWDGNNSDFIAQNVVYKDGHMILCLTKSAPTGYSGAAIEDNDMDAPYPLWARRFDNEIEVYFSEALAKTSAETTGNYIISGVAIQQAALLPDKRTARLSTSDLDPAKSYNLIVTNIKDLATPVHTMPPSQIVVKNPVSLPAHIDVGGSSSPAYLADQIWEPALSYGRSGGKIVSHSASLDIAGTDEDKLFQTEVRGINFYDLRLPDGRYNLILRFAETEFSGAGQRVFDVRANGQAVIDDLDIFAEAGANHACDKVLANIEVSGNHLQLYFSASIGQTTLSGIKNVPQATDIEQGNALPEFFDLRIFPNPFNPVTHIAYRLEKSAEVDIQMFNAIGQQVSELSAGRQSPGDYQMRFEAAGLTSGVYFCRVNLDGRPCAVKRAVLTK